MFVLDTHAWVWWASEDKRLSRRARRAIEAEGEAGVPAISVWEVALLVEKGVVTLDPRGVLFDAENIAERLSVRDFMTELREAGVPTTGPKGFGPADRQRFAATLDRELGRLVRSR